MTSFTIFGQHFSTIQSLKDFALLHGIVPTGNKSIKENWIKAITIYLAAQDAVITIAVQSDPIASTIAAETEKAAVSIGTVIVAVLTSETAVLAYRVILKAIAFTLVLGWLVSVAAVKWCWERRSHTAVYHWVKDALSSEVAIVSLTCLILGQWWITARVDSVRSAVTSTVQSCRVWVDGIIGEVRSVVG